jgi:hypothetical protein
MWNYNSTQALSAKGGKGSKYNRGIRNDWNQKMGDFLLTQLTSRAKETTDITPPYVISPKN